LDSRELVWPALGVLGAWSAASPFVAEILGLKLDVPARVEIVDHVMPGLAVAACSIAVLAYPRLCRPDAAAALVLSAICVLAGLWITVSHVPLLVDAADGAVPAGTAIFHALSGPPLLALALVQFVGAYRASGESEVR